MITYEEALATILSTVLPLPKQRVRLDKLLGCVLAEPAVTRTDLPHFDNSAVDGYGVCVSDLGGASIESPVRLKLAGVIQAGDAGDIQMSPGTTVKILTGAPVPAGVEAVVMLEYCDEQNGDVYVRQPVNPGENVRRRGEEFLRGQEVLESNIRVSPPVVGLLATLGYPSFMVYRRPRVALISTGNELVEPGKPLLPGQIYDSNSYALASALSALGVEASFSLHARDDQAATSKAFARAMSSCDVVISLGGVSVGDYDFVKDVVERLGVSTIFWRIAMKPGKPVYFGQVESPPGSRQKLVFGLPGNPVSALVTFHQLVRPALLKMMGLEAVSTMKLSATVKKSIRKRAGRLEFVRGALSTENGQLYVQATSGQESHMLGGLSRADCLIYFERDAELLAEGDQVAVELLNWG